MAEENATGAPASASAPVVVNKTESPAPKADALSALREVLQPVTEKQKRQERIAKAEAKGANEVLKGLGVKKSERARMLEEIKSGKVQLNAANEQAGEFKSRAEKAEAELKALKDRASAYESLAKSYADDQFNALPEPLQKYIAATAGDSLDARLKAIKTAKESGLIDAKEAAAATAQVKSEAKPAKPADTSKATQPKAPSPAGELTHKQVWQQMRAPKDGESHGERIARERLAAQYYAAHQISIDADF